jgi:hypothetical protein
MEMFALTVVCILTGVVIMRRYDSMRRMQEARVRDDESRER